MKCPMDGLFQSTPSVTTTGLSLCLARRVRPCLGKARFLAHHDYLVLGALHRVDDFTQPFQAASKHDGVDVLYNKTRPTEARTNGK